MTVAVSAATVSAPRDTTLAALSGFVEDSTTKETLVGATVAVTGTKLGAYTNKSGYFSISNIKPGTYDVVVSMLGYGRRTLSITFKAGETRRVRVAMSSGDVTLREVNVTAAREADRRQISISKVNVPMEQIATMRIGGEADIFRALQMLPGVLTSSQISSGLFIRGGSPDQNLVLLDGMTVYNPTHLFGFISAFNSDAIKDVELLKGGFPAEFGGRMSAVLNVTQKDGNRDRVEGVLGIGLISSQLPVHSRS
jgi:outer membrane receptor protein involved in Fe transport